MLKPKRKIHKHDLKEDKFVKTTLQAKSFIDENYQQVLMIVGGIFVVLVIIVLYNYLSNQNQEEAESILGIAQIEYSNANYQSAAERLETLIREYGSTSAGEQGMFLLANIYFQQKKYTESADLYQEFIDSYSGSNILLSSGYAGLAACRETEKMFTEAAQLYASAADKASDFVESENYRYLAGLNFKKAGENDEAIKQFKLLIDEPTTKSRVADAKTQLLLLGGTQ